jgi:hypothetical protein
VKERRRKEEGKKKERRRKEDRSLMFQIRKAQVKA